MEDPIKQITTLHRELASLQVEKANLTAQLLTLQIEAGQTKKLLAEAERKISHLRYTSSSAEIDSQSIASPSGHQESKPSPSNSEDNEKSSLVAQIAELEKELESSRDTILLKEKEIRLIKVELSGGLELKDRLATLTRDRDALAAQLDASQRALESKQQDYLLEISQLKSQLTAAELEIIGLSAAEAPNDDEEGASASKVAALIEEIGIQNETHQRQMQLLRDRIAELESTLPQQLAFQPNASKKMRAFSLISPSSTMPKQSTGADRAQLKQRLLKLRDELLAVTGNNARVEKWFSMLQISLAAEFEALLDAKNVAESRALEEQLLRSQEAKMLASQYEKRINELEMELESLQAKSAQLLEVTAGRREALHEHLEQIRLLESENDSLKREISSLRIQESTETTNAAHLQLQMAQLALHNEIFLKDQQLEHLKKELKRCVSERQQEEQQMLRLRDAVAEADVIRAARAQRENEMAQYESNLRTKLERILQATSTDNVEGLLAVIADLESSRQAVQELWETSQHRVDHLEAERTRLQEEMQLTEREYEEQIRSMEEAHKIAVDRLREALTVAESKIRVEIERYVALEARLRDETARAKESEKRNQQVAASLAEARSELAKYRAIAESERFKQLGVVETPTSVAVVTAAVQEADKADRLAPPNSSAERLVPVGQGRMRAGYSTRNRAAAEDEKKKQQQPSPTLLAPSINNPAVLRERRMTAARLSVLSPVFKPASAQHDDLVVGARVSAAVSSAAQQQQTTAAASVLSSLISQFLKRECKDSASPSIAFRLQGLDKQGLSAVLRDGVVACFLINHVTPNTIDFRTVSSFTHISDEQRRENWNLAFASAGAIGCNMQGINEDAMIQHEDHTQILRFCWEIIRFACFKRISISYNPRFARLYAGKSLGHVAGKKPEEILCKWMHRTASAYAGDDAEILMTMKSKFKQVDCFIKDQRILRAIALGLWATTSSNAGSPPNLEGLDSCISFINSLMHTKKAFDIDYTHFRTVQSSAEAWMAVVCSWHVAVASTSAGGKFLQPTGVASNIPLNDATFQKSVQEYAEIEIVGTREERALCSWINSLKLSAHVSNLHKDVCDGLVLLHMLERINPGCVDWGKVNLTPRNHFSRLENCNQVVSCCKKLGFSLVGISGSNIAETDRRGILALVWQAAQYHLGTLLSGHGRHKVDEQGAIRLANHHVKRGGYAMQIESFRDAEVVTGRFLIVLLDALRPGTVNKEYIASGNTEAERISNASYAISLARKCGCFIFAVPEDLVKPVPKMVFSFVAAVLAGTSSDGPK